MTSAAKVVASQKNGALRSGRTLSVEKESQADVAYRLLKGLILDGALPAGTQLLESEAAERLEMSRTPVREAMVRLRQEGIVEIRPRHGMRVLPISPADMREIYEVLTSLEGTAAALVARRGLAAGELAALKTAVHDMDAALDGNDLQAWAEADEHFHSLLVGFCGNGRLAGTIGQFQSQAHRARLLTLSLRPKPVTSNRDHEALVRAIEAGDPDEARRIHCEHRERAGRVLVAILERLPQIQV